MKKINSLLLTLAAVFTLTWTSCDDEIEYTPAEPVSGAQVYFPSTVSSTINLSSTENSYQIPVMRVVTDEALSVAVTATGGEDLYTVPSSVDFAQGESETTLTITYDPDVVGFDNYIEMTLAIADATTTTPYGLSEYSFTIGIPAPWVSLGNATYREDFVTTFYSADNVEYAVEIQENQIQPGYFRLVNPYGAAYPYNEEGDWDDSQDWYIEIHAEDPTAVYIPVQETGMDWGYGMCYAGSLAGYYIAQGSTLEEVKAQGLTGTYENGVITFPAETLLFGMADYNNGGLYTANTNGAFRVIMPGAVVADYSINVAYTGSYTDPNGYNYALGNVTLGADVEEARVALAPEATDVNTVIAGIVDGSIEYTTIEASGEVRLKSAGNGTYNMVAVSFANDEAQEAAVANFVHKATEVTPINAYVGQWTLTGVNYYTDAPYQFQTPVTISQVSEDSLTVSGAYPIGGYNDTFGLKYDTESGYVILQPQEVATLVEDATTVVVPFSMNEFTYTTSETLTGLLDENGCLSFSSTYGNEGAWDSFAYVLSSEEGVSLVSYYATYLTPYTVAATSQSFKAANSVMQRTSSAMKIVKVAVEEETIQPVAIPLKVRYMNSSVDKTVHATSQAVAFIR